VTRRLNDGQTPDYIRQSVRAGVSLASQIRATKIRKAAERAKAAGVDVAMVCESPPVGYTPGRRAGKPGKEGTVEIGGRAVRIAGKAGDKRVGKVADALVAEYEKKAASPTSTNGKGDGKANGKGNGSQTGEGLVAAELRRAIAMADEREAKVAILRQDWVERSQVNWFVGGMIVKARDLVFRVPEDVSEQVAMCDEPAQCAKIIRDALVTAVGEMREMLADMAGGRTEEKAVESDDEVTGE